MALEGHLRDLPLIDMLYIFRSTHKTGKVCFSSDANLSMIWVQDGELVHAVMLDKQTKFLCAQGVQAMYMLLNWKDAKFRFIEPVGDEHIQVSISEPLEVILFQALKQKQDQRLHQSNLQPGSLIRLVPQLEPGNGAISLSIDHWRIISHLVIETTVDDLARDLEYPYEHIIKLLEEMLALNLVSVRTVLHVPQRRTTLTQQSNRIREVVNSVKQRLRSRIQRGTHYVNG